MILEHCEEVEADLARWYQPHDQLPAFWRGEMSPRRLWALVKGIPQDSHTARILHGEEADWTLEAALLARVGNLLIQVNSPKRVPESKLLLPPSARKQAKPTTPPGEKPGGWAELDALFTGGKKAG